MTVLVLLNCCLRQKFVAGNAANRAPKFQSPQRTVNNAAEFAVSYRTFLCPNIRVNLFIASVSQHHAIKEYTDVEIRLLPVLEIV